METTCLFVRKPFESNCMVNERDGRKNKHQRLVIYNAAHAKDIIGFDHVMIYKLAGDGQAEMIAYAKDDNLR